MNRKLLIRRIIFRYSASILLILVAVHQIILVNTADLTHYKGGGFAMYASIDIPHRRVLQAEGVDIDGNPVVIELTYPGSPISTELIESAKTLPEKSLLKNIAHKLLGSNFVLSDRNRKSSIENTPTENLNIDMENMRDKKNIYRILGEGETNRTQKDIVRLQKVQLQIWRLRFDQSTNRVRREPLGEPFVVYKQK